MNVAFLDDPIAPRLIDEPAKYFLDGALKKSHQIRLTYHRIIWNVGLVLAFFLAFGVFLYYRYTNKPTQAESNYKLIKDQEYVLSKIRYFQEQHQRIATTGSEITGLPTL